MNGSQQLPQGGNAGGANFPQGLPPGGGMGGPGGPGGHVPGGGLTSIVLIAVFAATLIVLAVAFYKLYQRAGLSGAIGLLMLVPAVNLGVALYLAFAEWPVLTELARVRLLAASVPQPVAVASPATVAPGDSAEPAIPLTT